MTGRAYRLVVAATADRSLARLTKAVAAAVVEFMVGSLVEAPGRVGHPPSARTHRALVCEAWLIPRRDEVDDSAREVKVLRIDHRFDVYRPR